MARDLMAFPAEPHVTLNVTPALPKIALIL